MLVLRRARKRGFKYVVSLEDLHFDWATSMSDVAVTPHFVSASTFRRAL